MTTPLLRQQFQNATGARVTLATRKPVLSVSAYLADSLPTVSSGYGGWEEVARSRNVAFSEWQGQGLRRLTLPLIFAGVGGEVDQEPILYRLERMAYPLPRAGHQPPIVRVTGPVPASRSAVWVVEDIEWGENVMRRPSDGHRIRQSATVTLMRYVAPVLAFTKSAAQRAAAAATASVVYTTKTGDTMAKVAVSELGSAGRWSEIRALNPSLGSDPRKVIPTGTRIRVPAS